VIVVEAGTMSGVPARGMALPSFCAAIRPSTDALAGRVEAEEGLLPGETEPHFWGPLVPLVVTGPEQLPLEERGLGVGRFWAMANVEVSTSTQPSNVESLFITLPPKRGALPLGWNGSDSALGFQKHGKFS
jgi:hypothetical protein